MDLRSTIPFNRMYQYKVHEKMPIFQGPVTSLGFNLYFYTIANGIYDLVAPYTYMMEYSNFHLLRLAQALAAIYTCI